MVGDEPVLTKATATIVTLLLVESVGVQSTRGARG